MRQPCPFVLVLLMLLVAALPVRAQAPRSHDTIDMRDSFAPPASAPASAASNSPPAASAAPIAGPVPRLLRSEPPRDTAHHIGDVLLYRALISWPAGWEIDRDGLPDTSGAERPIELRSHSIVAAEGPDCDDCRWLTLQWQLFKGPRASEDQPLAAIPVRLRRGSDVVTLVLPATVISVSPLVPWDSRRNWLDSARPGWRAVPFDVRARFAEAGLALSLAALALLAWAWTSGRLTLGVGHRPFAKAWRQLRTHKRPAGTPADANDLRLLHRAIDATAGEAVFIESLDAFFATYPALAPMAAEVRRVFDISRQYFFLPGGESAPRRMTHGELIDVVARCARAEFTVGKAVPQPSTGAARA